MEHVNVIIATPGHSMMSSYVKSLLHLSTIFAENKITWAWASEYSSHVADARELTLSGTYENNIVEQRPLDGNVDYDKILWIDSDITFTAEDAMKLIQSEKDIVSGAYLLSGGDVPAYPRLLGAPYVHSDIVNMTEPVKVDACGFGFLAVKKGVFESLTRPWFQSALAKTDDGIEFPILGEDLSWCKRVGDLGYEIWLDPSVKLVHTKMMKITWEGPKP